MKLDQTLGLEQRGPSAALPLIQIGAYGGQHGHRPAPLCRRRQSPCLADYRRCCDGVLHFAVRPRPFVPGRMVAMSVVRPGFVLDLGRRSTVAHQRLDAPPEPEASASDYQSQIASARRCRSTADHGRAAAAMQRRAARAHGPAQPASISSSAASAGTRRARRTPGIALASADRGARRCTSSVLQWQSKMSSSRSSPELRLDDKRSATRRPQSA